MNGNPDAGSGIAGLRRMRTSALRIGFQRSESHGSEAMSLVILLVLLVVAAFSTASSAPATTIRTHSRRSTFS
jgi:hypothetical protein